MLVVSGSGLKPRLKSIEFLYSMFDLPKADKCLPAYGGLDVQCLQSASGGFDVHQFLTRSD